MEKSSKNFIDKVPSYVTQVLSVLQGAGFEAYMVGGCVRDLLLAREPKDWDVTTNATPDDIISLFEKTVYENNFGTVAVCIPTGNAPEADSKQSSVSIGHSSNNVSRETHRKDVPHETIQFDVSDETSEESQKTGIDVPHETQEGQKNNKYDIVEVTPYRLEAKYSDFRHPDEVKFSKRLEDDLKRRDFTVNAMAMNNVSDIKDMYNGIQDIKDKVLRTVGNPDERFNEDALRMLRAVRFACQLDFTVSHETMESIAKNSDLIKNISSERIRDEFAKIILSDNPAMGMMMLEKLGLLKHIVPELIEGVGCEQGGEHIYDVWNHLLHALQHAADKKWGLEIRIAALFHDIGKPRTKRPGVKKPTFYGHEVVGAKMARKIMDRLKFTKKETDLVETLVRNHMFFSDTEQITLSAVRRIIAKVSVEHIWDLMNIRECDRVGMKKKEAPYRLRKYFAMIEEALHDPISVKQLKIDGNYLMKELHMKPGPRMGWMLNALLEEVLEDSSKNTIETLSLMVKEMDVLKDNALRELGEKGRDKKEELEEEAIGALHAKHGVSTRK